MAATTEVVNMTISAQTACNLDTFYSTDSTQAWQQIIGQDLHYHFGFFSGTEDLETGLKQTVRRFYPQIPQSAQVLDIGCGWGGPARLLKAEKQCAVTGVTISQAQTDFCTHQGLVVQQYDLEQDDWPIQGDYDLIFSLEMMSHIRDKVGLLRRLRPYAKRLIVSESCAVDDYSGQRMTFGDSMMLCTVAELQCALEEAGWRICSLQNRRFQSLRTIILWKKNFDTVYGDQTPPGQLAVLRNLVEGALPNLFAWGQAFPLIDIIAE
jgi:cyclopropane fatty-acyl-phospholipid synthase-like methyltransferase